MGFEFFTVRFGPPATALLRALVAAEQAADPFAPVTVVVADNLTGVMARRALAQAGGVANVSFVTVEALAARCTGGRVPVAGPLEVAAAARDVLARQSSGLFAPVAAHPATEVAVVAAHRTLAGAAPDTLAELAASPSARTRAVVALHRAIAARLAPLADEHALARQAAARVAADPQVVAPLGALVVHLVDELPPAATELLVAIAAARRVSVVVGTTGVPEADLATTWWAHHAGAPELEGRHDGPPLPARPSAFSATDSDDEVRHVVRTLLARAEAGVPFHRMAVLWTSADPYARVVLEQLAAAGVPHNGPAVRPVSGLVAGRAIRALLALADGRWRRTDVLDLAGIAPGIVAGAAPDGSPDAVPDAAAAPGPRPVVRWDTVSRAAGVVAGLDDWRTKLDTHRRAARTPAERAAVTSLRAFVDELAADLAAGRACTTWPALAAWATAALDRLVGDPSSWPEAERRGLDTVREVLAATAGLTPFDRRPSLESLARALDTALEVPSQRVGTLGRGVQCGPLDHARALDADVVFVVGVAEGLCPAPATEDTLLPDTERRRARHGELALATSRVASTHRALLMAFAAARHECIAGHPRGDHRGGRTRVPSRWLTYAAHLPGVASGADLFAAPRGPVHDLPSFEAALLAAPTAAHAAEHRLALLRPAGASVGAHALCPPELARAAVAVTARRSPAFTAFDGNLGGRAVPSPATATTSASRLEEWAACPFRYFASAVLRLRERDTPEAVDEVDARERGSLVHLVLERFVREQLAAPPAPHEPWPAGAADRLHEIATEEFARAEARGVTGPPVRWRREQLELRRVLDSFLAADAALRAGFGSTPVAVELAFGLGGDDSGPPLPVSLPDGRTLTFRGVIDRVDRTADGLVVLDYKTGKGTAYGAITEDDPFVRGTKLQLPLYALAAQRAFEAPHAEAHYVFVEQQGKRVGYRVDDERLAGFTEVVTTIADGIEAGVFPARPGAYNSFYGTHQQCTYCDFDRLCPRARGDHWEAKTAAVAVDAPLAGYLRLAGGSTADDASEATS